MASFLEECDVPDIFALDPRQIHAIRSVARGAPSSTRVWVDEVLRLIRREDGDRLALIVGNAIALRPQVAIALVRKHGLLRASKSAFNTAIFTPTLRRFEFAFDHNLVGEEVDHYRRSVQSLYELAGYVLNARETIASRLNADAGWFLGSLQTLDLLFARKILRIDDGPPMKGLALRAEAFSTLCGLDGVFKRVALHEGNLGPETKRIVDGEFLQEIDSAIPLRLFDEWERLVDLFDYRCAKDKKGFRISPPTQRVERCIRLGYLQSVFSKEPFRTVQDQDQYPSYSDVLLQLERLGDAAGKSRLVESILGDHSRFRLNIPDVPEIWKLIGSIPFFREELSELAVVCDAFGLEAQGLLDVSISEHVTLRDVLVFHRILSLLAEATRQRLRHDMDADLPKVLRSLAPAASTESLRAILGYATSLDAASGLLDLFTATSLSYFDVQYRPLIKVRKLTLLPLNIVSASAVIRNVLQTTNRRIDHAGRDPEEQIIVASFETSGAYAKSNIQYRTGGSTFEIDVLALVETTLVVIEVKRGLLPTNTKELQTTFEAAEAAAEQLDRDVMHLASIAHKKAIGIAFGKDLSGVTQVITCIALTNRMLSGLRIGGHPVRGSRDLAAFVLDGTTRLVQAGVELTGRYRPKGPLAAKDIEEYLVHDVLHNDLIDSMKRHDLTYSLHPTRVVVETAVLDIRALNSKLKARA